MLGVAALLLWLLGGDCSVDEGDENCCEGEFMFMGGDCIVGNRREGESKPDEVGGEEPKEESPKRGMVRGGLL